jgi:cell division control protein 45
MLIPLPQWEKAYQLIKSESLNSGCSVLIFVSHDCDAICACRILTHLLASDMISFAVMSVSGEEELQQSFRDMTSNNEQLRSVILLNCGGTQDLYELFELHKEEYKNLTFYVIDSHRPYSTANIANLQQILVLDDSIEVSVDPLNNKNGDNHFHRSTYEKEENDREKERNERGDGEATFSESAWPLAGSTLSSKLRQEDDHEQVGDDQQPVATSSEHTPAAFFGSTIAGMTYALAAQLNKTNNDLLWYALVGLTDQYIHQRISATRYRADAANFKVEVMNRNTHNYEHAELACIEDYPFMLYRHWTLYDSMYYSRAVAIALGIWKVSGQQRLQILLAKMGLPLDQARQPFAAMETRCKTLLFDKLPQYASEFRLKDLQFPSFQRRYGSDLILSASDAVYAVTALLESPHTASRQLSMEVEELQLFTSDGKDSRSSLERDVSKLNFWRAYDALGRNVDMLRVGLREAIQLQIALVQRAVALINKKEIVQSGPFRYVLLTPSSFSSISASTSAVTTHSSFDQYHYFAHPLALARLGHFLVDTLLEMGKTKKPLIVGAWKEETKSYLLVGLPGRHSGEVVKANKFSTFFAQAAHRTKARVTHHHFDTQIVQVHRDDIVRFLEYLRSGLVI